MVPQELQKAAELAWDEWANNPREWTGPGVKLTYDGFIAGYLAGRGAGIIVIGPLEDSMKDIPGIKQFDTWSQAYIHLRRENASSAAGSPEDYRSKHRKNQ